MGPKKIVASQFAGAVTMRVITTVPPSAVSVGLPRHRGGTTFYLMLFFVLFIVFLKCFRVMHFMLSFFCFLVFVLFYFKGSHHSWRAV